jgi:DnaJ-related protein SCJ1
VQQVKGQGLPIFEQGGKFGDLFVEYNVILPSTVSPSLRASKSMYQLITLNLFIILQFHSELADAFRPVRGKDEL